MTSSSPLAESLRPKHWSDIIGQQHLLGPNKPLRLAFETGVLHSMILWGPPGVGKTSLARLTAETFDCEWIALSAVFSGVKDIRNAIETAEKYKKLHRKTILFIDEIHRFNTSQQDALLPYTESGLITLIGATTENPSFAINAALLSRLHVHGLKSLTNEELTQLLHQTCKTTLHHLKFANDAEHLIVNLADGDARRLLNMLEHVSTHAAHQEEKQITPEWLMKVLPSTRRRFDKSGDYFYDQISALHKSVRGSDPDAALYWFCRMLDGGADPAYLARRIIRMAWEDIGLADPRAMQIVNDAASSFERLGSPEGDLALAEAVIYLAVAPKSNASYLAFNQAMAFVKNDRTRDVPLHLRNAPTKLMKQQGHGAHYRYAHDEPHGFATGQNYLPDGMKEPHWYQPVDRGLEIKIRERLAFLKALK